MALIFGILYIFCMLNPDLVFALNKDSESFKTNEKELAHEENSRGGKRKLI